MLFDSSGSNSPLPQICSRLQVLQMFRDVPFMYVPPILLSRQWLGRRLETARDAGKLNLCNLFANICNSNLNILDHEQSASQATRQSCFGWMCLWRSWLKYSETE